MRIICKRFSYHRAENVFCTVALLAVYLGVLTNQRKSRLAVVKELRRKPDGCCFSAEVFLVAVDTGSSRLRKMKTVLILHLVVDFLMAGKTLFPADLPSHLMTFRAVGRSFQTLM